VRCRLSHDDVDPDTNEIRRQVRELIGAPFRRQSIFEDDAAPFDVAEVAESRSERFHASQRRRAGEEEADPWGAARALRFSGERRKRETESENDREPDPPHGHLYQIQASDRYSCPDEKTELDAEDGSLILPHKKVLTVHVAATSFARQALLTDGHLQPEAITGADWLQQLDAQVIAAEEGPFDVRGPDYCVD
jgi:hypothetical protein